MIAVVQRSLFLAFILLLTGLSGCTDAPLTQPGHSRETHLPEPANQSVAPGKNILPPQVFHQDDPEVSRAHRPLAVVAMNEIPNVYHELFRRPEWTRHPSEFIPEYPKEARPVNLTLDAPSLEEALTADRAVWESLTPFKLYYIPGTVFVGFIPSMAAEKYHPTAHGTGIAGNLVDATDRVGIVFADFWIERGPTFERDRRWIDSITDSSGSIPLPTYWSGEWQRLHFTEEGGIVFSAVPNTSNGNCVPFTPNDVCGEEGPPWVVLVGKVDSTGFTHGNGPLDIAMVSQECPRHDDLRGFQAACAGTSFATPRVAGVAMSLLAQVRDRWGYHDCPLPYLACTDVQNHSSNGPLADGDLSREELLDVLYHTAVPGRRSTYSSVAPFTEGYTDEGWGVIDGNTVANATLVLHGEKEPLPRAQAEKWWRFHQERRSLIWQSLMQTRPLYEEACALRPMPGC